MQQWVSAIDDLSIKEATVEDILISHDDSGKLFVTGVLLG